MWVQTPYLNAWQKAYFIKNYITVQSSELIYSSKKAYCVFNQIDDLVIDMTLPTLIIHWFVVTKDIIDIRGRVVFAGSIFAEDQSLVVHVGDTSFPILTILMAQLNTKLMPAIFQFN